MTKKLSDEEIEYYRKLGKERERRVRPRAARLYSQVPNPAKDQEAYDEFVRSFHAAIMRMWEEHKKRQAAD